MRSLITGVGGFAGQYLAQRLRKGGDTVYGVARRPVPWHVSGVADGPGYAQLWADLTLPAQTHRVVEEAAPERVYHLAAASSVQESFLDPVGTLQNNISGLVNLLEAVRALAPQARVLVVSSSEIYGRSRDAAPLDETAELRPESPYAVSKAAQDLLGYQYHVAHGLDVVRVRPFNHIGPGQSDHFVAASLARQIAEIEAGLREPAILVGNLDAQRDFTDVRDMVRAYELALQAGEPGAVYNIGRGSAVSIRTMLEQLIARSGVPVSVRVDPARLRRADAPVAVGDASRFRQRTHWEPQIPLEATLADLLSYWRRQVGGP